MKQIMNKAHSEPILSKAEPTPSGHTHYALEPYTAITPLNEALIHTSQYNTKRNNTKNIWGTAKRIKI